MVHRVTIVLIGLCDQFELVSRHLIKRFLRFYSLLLPLILFLHRACLVATIRSSGASQSTIKLVATNLIASGKLAGEHYRGN